MGRRLLKNKSIRMAFRDWQALDRAAARETDRRGETVEGGTLARELIVRGVRRINARAERLAQSTSVAA